MGGWSSRDPAGSSGRYRRSFLVIDNRQRTIDNRQRTTVNGQQTTGNGQRAMDSRTLPGVLVLSRELRRSVLKAQCRLLQGQPHRRHSPQGATACRQQMDWEALAVEVKAGKAQDCLLAQPLFTSVSAGASSKPSRARASMPRRRCSSRTPAPRSLCCALRSSRWHNADAGVTEGRVSLSVENEERLPDVADAVAVEWATCGTVGDVADVVQIVGASAAVAFGVAAGAQL